MRQEPEASTAQVQIWSKLNVTWTSANVWTGLCVCVFLLLSNNYWLHESEEKNGIVSLITLFGVNGREKQSAPLYWVVFVCTFKCVVSSRDFYCMMNKEKQTNNHTCSERKGTVSNHSHTERKRRRVESDAHYDWRTPFEAKLKALHCSLPLLIFKRYSKRFMYWLVSREWEEKRQRNKNYVGKTGESSSRTRARYCFG